MFQQLQCGCTPSVDGLPVEFYQRFWTVIGKDLFAVCKECLDFGMLPVSCTRAALSVNKEGGSGTAEELDPLISL